MRERTTRLEETAYIKPRRAFSRSPKVSSVVHLFLHQPKKASMVTQVSWKQAFLL